jgi:hypothetical protein
VYKAVLLALVALAAAPAAARAEEKKILDFSNVRLSGMVDAFFTANLDKPQSYEFVNVVDGSEFPLRYADQETGFNLNFVKLAAEMDADPAGFRIDLAFAPEGEAVSNLFVEQAYVSVKLGKATLDFGRFVTPAGFELFESKDNWLYTKGLIFTLALPTAHEGVRVAYPVLETLTLTAYLANGSDLFSNDTGGNGGITDALDSPYKTGVLSAVYADETLTAALNGFVSRVPGSGDYAYQVDAVVTKAFGPLSVNLSGDYGWIGDEAFYAVGGSARYSVADDLFRVAGRVELFDDLDGLRTGVDARYTSATLGATYPVGGNAELRAEVRYDFASEDVFAGDDHAGTATVAALAWF